jgi:hypothetical protein
MDSLFDEWPPSKPAPPDPPEEALESQWVEMPQDRFLSLPIVLQLHYCWQRDLDSATTSADDDTARFFLSRAAMYEAMLAEEKQKAITQNS